MPRMFEDRPGDDPTSHAPKATEGEDASRQLAAVLPLRQLR
jgi:hypothetical protein